MGFEASIVIDIKIINNHLVDEDNKNSRLIITGRIIG